MVKGSPIFFIERTGFLMHSNNMITAAQIRAARALLGWSCHKLSELSGVAHSTIADYETERTASMLSETMRKISETFFKHGVVFIDMRGVAFKEGHLASSQTEGHD